MSNLILKKTTSAIFLTIVLIAGTFAAISPLFITGVNAEIYYGMDKDRKSDKKDVSVQSLKCNNINVNVNGLELSVLPPFLGGEVAAEAEDGTTDANSLENHNGVSNSGSQINDFRFICINNNNNTVVEEQQPEPPKPTTTTLTVTKLVTCEDTRLTPVNGPTCADLLGNITENQFNITVEDFIESPSEFAGSETGTTVTLNPSNYTVTETPDDSVAQEIETLGGNITGPAPSFTGDCRPAIPGPFEAIGTIAAGDSQTCNIENHFVIEEETACDACFARLDINTRNAINDLLETIPDGGIFLSTPRITIPVEVDSTEALCEFFSNIPTITVTSAQRVALVNEFAHSSTSQISAADAIIDCLEEVGKIIVRDFPPV